jgi:pyridoxal phosphate enzyme (YggS family)
MRTSKYLRRAALLFSAASIALAPTAASTIRWHLIGHLQRNKVRRTLPVVNMIHSVDSERLLAAIDEVASSNEFVHAESEAPPKPENNQRPRVSVLLEVNTSGESAKQGLPPGDVEALLVKCGQLTNVKVCGLMTMAALEGGETAAARSFAMLRDLRDQLQRVAPENVELMELSMGMSGDFETAIAAGATMIRVGSALWDNL